MSWDTNIYYSPEKSGLRTVGEAEFSSGSYEFDTTVVWQDVETGDCFYADDSGCSCPTPFESESRESVTRITRLQDLIDHLEERKRESYYYSSDYDTSAKAGIDGECADLIRAYMTAVK